MRPNNSISIKRTLILISLVAIFLLPISVHSVAVSATTASCSPAGNTTLTAYLVITHSHTTVSGKTINAQGCDIGIYVSPGLSWVTIQNDIVIGANQHGILVQDDSHVTIENNAVTGNGVATKVCPPSGTPPPGCIPENKPIELVGTSDSLVTKNVVSFNGADGGIGIADDGPQNPGAPTGVAGASMKATDDSITWNTIVDNTMGCGIVIAAYNPDVGLFNIVAEHNTIVGSSPAQVMAGAPAYIGQIVVATDAPDTTISNIRVQDNTLDGSFLPGIVLHANVFGDKILYTQIVGNVLQDNGYYPGPPNPNSNTPTSSQGTTGISIVAENPPPPNQTPAAISHTLIAYNTITGDQIGVWLCYTEHTTVIDIDGNPTTTMTTCVAGGS
jgi:hypothetical protein